MRIAIVEVCRSPEVQKWGTEGQVLHAGLPKLGLTPVLCSNDHSWRGASGVRAWPGPAGLFRLAHQQRIDVLHLAMHGTADGLVLGWKGALGQREPRTVLTPAMVRERLRLNGRLVVSGACQSAHMADDFLAAGACAVVAPRDEVPWANLGAVFLTFYAALAIGQSPRVAMTAARKTYPELASYRCFAG